MFSEGIAVQVWAEMGWFFLHDIKFQCTKKSRSRFLRKIRYAQNMVNEAFLGPKSTLLNVSLNLLFRFFFKILLDESH